MRETSRPLSQLVKCWTRFPQLVTNVKVREKIPFEKLDGVLAMVSAAELELKSAGGRVLLRYSGTEPKARLLLEGSDEDILKDLSRRICGAIEKQIGV
jgi:phosphoglucosamine mutase